LAPGGRGRLCNRPALARCHPHLHIARPLGRSGASRVLHSHVLWRRGSTSFVPITFVLDGELVLVTACTFWRNTSLCLPTFRCSGTTRTRTPSWLSDAYR